METRNHFKNGATPKIHMSRNFLPKTMKIIKLLTLGLLFVGAISLSSCKKYAKKEDVKNTVIENLDITIQPYQWTWNSSYNSWEYSHSHEFINDGVLVGYVMNGQGKQALPFYDANTGVTYGLVDATFNNKIIVTYYDGTSFLTAPAYEEYVYLREINPDKKGNMRDFATLEQLVVLSSMESINALIIQQGLSQNDRLIQLNKVAISQMKSLLANNTMKKLK